MSGTALLLVQQCAIVQRWTSLQALPLPGLWCRPPGKARDGRQRVQSCPLRLAHPARQVVSDGRRRQRLAALAQRLVLGRVDRAVPQQDVEGQQRQHDELVAVKQAAACIAEDCVCARVQQRGHARLQCLGAHVVRLLAVGTLLSDSLRVACREGWTEGGALAHQQQQHCDLDNGWREASICGQAALGSVMVAEWQPCK